MDFQELKLFLDEKVDQYNNPNFIETDPVSIPHQFQKKQDIEVSGFFSSIIAWGNRKMILKNASKLMFIMGNSPYDFVMEANAAQLSRLDSFVHRTFNGEDIKWMVMGPSL